MPLKEFISTHKRLSLVSAAGIGLIILLIIAYVTAPSTVDVPKGAKYETNANIEQQTATVLETQANDTRDQKVAAHKDTVHSKANLQDKQHEYHQVQQTNNSNGISNTDLDRRERKLVSDLSNLYPGNR